MTTNRTPIGRSRRTPTTFTPETLAAFRAARDGDRDAKHELNRLLGSRRPWETSITFALKHKDAAPPKNEHRHADWHATVALALALEAAADEAV